VAPGNPVRGDETITSSPRTPRISPGSDSSKEAKRRGSPPAAEMDHRSVKSESGGRGLAGSSPERFSSQSTDSPASFTAATCEVDERRFRAGPSSRLWKTVQRPPSLVAKTIPLSVASDETTEDAISTRRPPTLDKRRAGLPCGRSIHVQVLPERCGRCGTSRASQSTRGSAGFAARAPAQTKAASPAITATRMNICRRAAGLLELPGASAKGC